MNNKMLKALGYCLALTLASNAQTKYADTIAITPLPGSKVFLIGNKMSSLLKENNFEVVKNQFISDMKKSAEDKAFPVDPKEAIYMIAADGRRRLKAKPEELAPFDTQKEINDFDAGLLPVHYSIYDLKKGFEYHIYLSDAQQLDQLSAINFSLALAAINDKEKLDRKYAKIEIEQDNDAWKTNGLPKARMALLELSTSFAVGLFNSTLSPGLGVHIDFHFKDKYLLSRYKVGGGLTLYALSEHQDYQFKNIYGAVGVDLRLMKNIAATNSNPLWIGFLAGRLRNGIDSSSLRNRWKFGFAVEKGFLGIEWAFIPPKNDHPSMTNLTFRFRF